MQSANGSASMFVRPLPAHALKTLCFQLNVWLSCDLGQDKEPNSARRKHWAQGKSCVACSMDLLALRSQTFNQLLNRKIALIQEAKCKWARDVFLLAVGAPNPVTKVKRVVKCKACGKSGSPYLFLRNICPKSQAGMDASVHRPNKAGRVKFMSKLHKAGVPGSGAAHKAD